jgi:hypothetical protein
MHLAHPALADRSKDFIRAEFFTWVERHLNESAKYSARITADSKLCLGTNPFIGRVGVRESRTIMIDIRLQMTMT